MSVRPGISQDLSRLVGADASEAFARLVEVLPEVAAVSTFSYSPTQLVQTRAPLTPGEQVVLKVALEVRERHALPFWDAVMLTCFNVSEDVSNLLDASMLHRRHAPEPMPRADVLNGRLADLCRRTGDEMIAVVSRVELKDGTRRHIALMDFHCPTSDQALAVVSAIARRLLPEGAIVLNSGQSYHAYGRRLLDEDEFLDFLARATLFAPIIDRAYCAHKWLERMSALRISSGGRAKHVPVVVAVQ